MKQKLLAVLAAFVAVTPLAGVAAADIQYTIGTEHNFIVNEEQERKHDAGDETVGIKVKSLGEETEDGHVKALAVGAVSWMYNRPGDGLQNSYKELTFYQHMYDDLNANVEGYTSELLPEGVTPKSKKETSFPDITVAGGKYVKDYNADDKWATVMTADEFLTWMKGENTTATTEYSLNETELAKFKSWFDYPLYVMTHFDEFKTDPTAVAPKGFYTSTYDKTSNKIWVVDVTISGTEVTGATLRQKLILSGTDTSDFTINDAYIAVPILYFNKTYDCKFRIVSQTACFKCGDEYQWIEVGKQASTCEAVSSITKKAKCVKPSNTGIEDYILEFAIAAGICGLVLVAVKRKSLFSRV